MDPQNNTMPQETPQSAPQDMPMQNGQPMGEEMPNGDGFGGPNIAYENFSNEAIQENQQAIQQEAAPIPINVINAVNANGIVSGRKVVDYTWQRGAICLMVLSLGLLIGLIVVIAMMMSCQNEIVKLQKDKDSINSNYQGLLTTLGVGTKEEAVVQMTDPQIVDGGDLDEINSLLAEKYGANYKLDLADHNINFIRRNGFYKVASFGIQRSSGSRRVILYERIADGKWILGSFDSTKDDPCADADDAEKEAIKNIIVCEAEEEQGK